MDYVLWILFVRGFHRLIVMFRWFSSLWSWPCWASNLASGVRDVIGLMCFQIMFYFCSAWWSVFIWSDRVWSVALCCDIDLRFVWMRSLWLLVGFWGGDGAFLSFFSGVCDVIRSCFDLDRVVVRVIQIRSGFSVAVCGDRSYRYVWSVACAMILFGCLSSWSVQIVTIGNLDSWVPGWLVLELGWHLHHLSVISVPCFLSVMGMLPSSFSTLLGALLWSAWDVMLSSSDGINSEFCW